MTAISATLKTFNNNIELLARLLLVAVEEAFEGEADLANVVGSTQLKKTDGFNPKTIKAALTAFESVGLVTQFDEAESRIVLSPVALSARTLEDQVRLIEYVKDNGELPPQQHPEPAYEPTEDWDELHPEQDSDAVSSEGREPVEDVDSSVVEETPRYEESYPASTPVAQTADPYPAQADTPAEEFDEDSYAEPAESESSFEDITLAHPIDPAPDDNPFKKTYGAREGGRVLQHCGVTEQTENAEAPTSAEPEPEPDITSKPPTTPRRPPTRAPKPAPVEESLDDTEEDTPQSTPPGRASAWTGQRGLPNTAAQKSQAAPSPTPSSEPTTTRSPRKIASKAADEEIDEAPDRLRAMRQRASDPGEQASPDQADRPVRGGIRGFTSRFNPPPRTSEASGGTNNRDDLKRLLAESGLMSSNEAQNLTLDAPTASRLLDELQAQMEKLRQVGLDSDASLQINLGDILRRIRASSASAAEDDTTFE